MTNRAYVNDESGFTIQETIVVMIVGSLLIGFSYMLYGFVAGFIQRNLEHRARRESTQHIAALMIKDLERARFVAMSDSSMVIEYPWRKTVQYASLGGIITRNLVMLTTGDSARWKAKWRSDTTNGGRTKIEVTINRFEGRDTVGVTTNVILPQSSQSEFRLGISRSE